MGITYQFKPLRIKPLSFFRKVQLGLTIGIVLSFLLIGVGIFYQQYLNIKHQLQSQGIALTGNLARNAEPFIVDYDKDQLDQFLAVMLDNPLVLFSGIINTHLEKPKIDVLKKQGDLDLKFVTEVVRAPSYQNIDLPKSTDIKYLDQRIIYCIAPIFSNFVFPDDETTLLYNLPRYKGIIGYGVIAYKLPFSAIFSRSIGQIVLMFGLVSIIVGSIIGYIIANGLIGRIRKIAGAVQSYKIGEELSIADNSKDEVADIARALSDMASLVNIQLNKIQEANVSLSSKVADQVHHIQELNEELTRFTQNQRSFVAQSLQESMRLFLLLPSIIHRKVLFDQVTNYIQFFIQQVIYLLQDNQEFSSLNQWVSVDVVQLIKEHESLLKWLAQKNNNVFSMQLEQGLYIQTDPKQLIQSLIQIILNAGKYTTNGKIELS